MYHELNISKDGRHYFATAPRSFIHEFQARPAYDDFVKRFPESEGFKITVTYYPEMGRTIDFGEAID